MGKDNGTGVEHLVLSNMQGIYVNELYWLLTAIRKNCEGLFEKAKIPEKGYVIQVDMEVHSLIKSIVSDSSQVANLIDPRKKRKDETLEHYTFRKRRGEHLMKIFNGIPIEIILNRELRNSMEHFDERLDNLVHKISNEGTKKQQNLAHNIVFSHRNVILPFPIPIRVYVSSEKIFYNMKWRFDIGNIYEECISMLNAVKSLESIKELKEPGGLLVIIPKLNK